MAGRYLPVPVRVRRGRLVRRERRLPARVVSLVPARALPVVRRSLLVAGAALAAEYALRIAVGGTLARLFSPVRSGASIARTEITEWLIIERFRRRQG